MQANYTPVGDLFSLQQRFVVPLFQRPYVWNEEEQWVPLWNDLRNVAEAALAASVAGPVVAPHFLGSVVLEQRPTPATAIAAREVIDGQQRLTTLQIVLKAAADAAASIDARQSARRFERLTRNEDAEVDDGASAGAAPVRPDAWFKVWPSEPDQPAYRRLLCADADSALDGAGTHRIDEAYRFFRKSIADWLGKDTEAGAKRASALASAFYQHLKLIVLDIEPAEDAQVIFETLNARGTPLLPLDLVKNWMLREAVRTVGDPHALYAAHWRDTFDNEIDYWREEVGRGHAQKPRADLFLQNFLAVRLRDEVTTGHLFSRFLADTRRAPILSTAARFELLGAAAGVFRQIDEPDEDEEVGRRLARIKELDVVTVYPFLMAALPKLSPATMLRLLEIIESFLVRRTVCSLNTRGYGRHFIEAAAVVADAPDGSDVATQVAAFFAKSDADAFRWPANDEFMAEWTALEAYRKLAKGTTRFILSAIEAFRRFSDGFAEPYELPPKLEIEHVMPQSWMDNWPLPSGAATDAATARNAALQRFGNLTLVTKKLNGTLSNAAWIVPDDVTSGKRATLRKYSLTKLREDIIESPVWSEVEIAARTQALFATAIEIWPPPPPKEP
jgi:hypothetical protein